MSLHIVGGHECNMGCDYSAVAGTKVLTADLEWVPIEDLDLDDEVVAFDRPEQTETNKESKLRESHITAIWKYKKNAVRVNTDRGSVVVGETHPFLSKHHGFRDAQNFDSGQEIRYVLDPKEYAETDEYQRGYVHGAFAGDGSIVETDTTKNATIRCQDSEVAETVAEYAPDEFGLELKGTDSNGLHEVRTTVWSEVELIKETHPASNDSMDSADYARGWLAGMFDTDGGFDGNTVRFWQDKEEQRDLIEQALTVLDYDYAVEENAIRVCGKQTRLKFLAELRPKVSRKVRQYDGTAPRGTATVESVEHVGERTFYDVTVDTYHTLVLDGFMSHNCYEEPAREIEGDGEMVFDYDMDAIMNQLREWKQSRPQSAPGLHGGEPLLMANEDIERIFKFIDQNWKDSPGIQTNGSLIKDEHVRMFKEYDVNVGISCDGPPELNELRRARKGGDDVTDEFSERTNRAINRLAVTEGTSVGLIVVLSKGNAETDEQLEKLLSWLDNMNRIGVNGHFNPAIPYDDEEVEDVSLDPDRLADVYERAVEWMFEKEHRSWGPFDQHMDNLMGNGLGNCVNRKCDVSNAKAAQIVKGDGEQTGCGKTWNAYGDGTTFLQGESSGNEFGERDERYDMLKQLPGWTTEDEPDLGGCKGCEYWSICQGGCPSAGLNDDWRNRSVMCKAKYAAYSSIEDQLRSMMPNIRLVTDLPWNADINKAAAHGQLDIEPFAEVRPGTSGVSSASGGAKATESVLEAAGGVGAIHGHDEDTVDSRAAFWREAVGDERVQVDRATGTIDVCSKAELESADEEADETSETDAGWEVVNE